MVTEARQTGPFRVLKHKGFWPLLAGRNLSGWGDALFSLALVWFVFRGTHSALATAGVAVAVRAAPVVVGPIAGVFVDRWDRRRTMMAVDLTRLLLLGILAWMDWAGVLTLWVVYAVAFLLAAAGTFFGPAFRSVLARVVPREDLATANGLWQSIGSANGFAASAAAGFVVAAVGTVLSFVLDAVSFLFSLGGVAMIDPSHGEHAMSPATGSGHSRFFAELKGGWQVVASDARLRPVLVVLFSVTIGGAIFLALLPVLVFQRLHGGPALLGILEAVAVVGSVVGGLMAGWVGNHFSIGVIITGSLLLLGLGVADVGASLDMWLTGAGLAVISFAESIVGGPVIALFQSEVPEELMGRAFGFLGAAEGAAGPISALLGGVLANAWNSELAVLAAAGWMFVVCVFTISQGSLWTVRLQ